jgi:hypothetical protein
VNGATFLRALRIGAKVARGRSGGINLSFSSARKDRTRHARAVMNRQRAGAARARADVVAGAARRVFRNANRREPTRNALSQREDRRNDANAAVPGAFRKRPVRIRAHGLKKVHGTDAAHTAGVRGKCSVVSYQF